MKDRKQIARDLDSLQARLKDLELQYERYFSGAEKREPYRERIDLTRQLRQYGTRLIVQTDLKFRYHGLTSRLASYAQYWDRILRQIDEGKFHRHLTRTSAPAPAATGSTTPLKEAKQLHAELLAARQRCGLDPQAPSAEKIASALAAQREKLKDKVGDRPIEFLIDISNGKPLIKARLKP
ncbi:MAG: hypothetical protein C0618_08145 [Desulfuromonas sp.]|nr:MAG: hypothetical protein C0618_08145 [Desulfuromonas sp.]